MQAEKMCRARNAGIVVTHRLLALPGDLFRRPGRNLADKVPEILLDPFLILRGWGNNLCRKNEPVLIEHVAMIEKAPGRFRGSLAGRGLRRCRCARCGRGLLSASPARPLVKAKTRPVPFTPDSPKRLRTGPLKPKC